MEGRGRTFVLIHGGFRGGWCFGPVASLLRTAGHVVYAPSLTGLGDRSHLAGAGVNASTHIQDVVNLVRWEQLTDIVLVGHSYGGFIIGGVADRIPDSIAALVYLDAIIPVDGMAVLDTMPAEAIPGIIKSTASHGGQMMPPLSAADFGLSGAMADLVDTLSTPQPLATLTERITLTGAYMNIARKVYVRAAKYPGVQPFYDQVRDAPGWSTFVLDCAHDLMLEEPEAVARILMEAT
jgi:pimeloyl-ACP methyl ester carboxylesterase